MELESRQSRDGLDTEQNLRRMATVVRDSNDAITLQDFDGRITAWNRGAERMYGYSEAEALAANIDLLTAPGKIAEQKDFIRRLVAGETITSFETQRVTKDGRVLDVWMTVTKLMDDAGNPVGLASTERDITQRKQAEHELRDGEEKYRRLIENGPNLIYTLNAEGVLTFVSSTWTAHLGHPVTQVTGQPFRSFVHPDDLAACQAFLESTLKTGQCKSGIESRWHHADGSWRWHFHSGSPIRDQSGTVVGLQATTTDITERKRAEDALQESEARYRMLFEHARDGIALADAETGRLVDCNQALCHMVERDKAELVGQPQAILHSPEDITEGMSPSYRQHLTKNSEHALEERLLSKGGTLIPVEIQASRIQMNKRFLLLGIFRDLTERKRAEAAREKLEDQLRQAQKMESVARLAGGVAHDFNNMLCVIIGRAELALAKLSPADPTRSDLLEVIMAGRHSASLTRQLLAFARKQVIAPRVLDLNDTVGGILTMLQRLIGENIDLRWEPGTNVWSVKMDPSQVDQILANLVVNARDAITDVGKVTIATEKVEIDAVYCTTHADAAPGSYVMLAVSDNGQGMDQEVVAHLFEPFFTTKETGKGTGLGLATVFGIVKQNHGFIDVHSEPGKGTAFKIYLPRHESAEAPLAAGEIITETPTGTETVLLAEDEPILLELAKIQLEELGYTVLAADTPVKAIRLAKKHAGEIQLLMTDVVMPEMSGRELLKQINLQLPGIKCLYMSGYTADIITQQGVLDEGIHFLQKPFSSATLAVKVREALEGK
jgi:PAS domain S-box-containing protein